MGACGNTACRVTGPVHQEGSACCDLYKSAEVRDKFAAAALTGLLSGAAPLEGPDWTGARLAELAFGIADAMMNEWVRRK